MRGFSQLCVDLKGLLGMVSREIDLWIRLDSYLFTVLVCINKQQILKGKDTYHSSPNFVTFGVSPCEHWGHIPHVQLWPRGHILDIQEIPHQAVVILCQLLEKDGNMCEMEVLLPLIRMTGMQHPTLAWQRLQE